MTDQTFAWTPLDPTRPPPLSDSSGHVVAVLASAPGRSPAETALGLARAWSEAGHRVVLADLSLDEPILHELLDLPNDEGVTDAVSMGASVGRVAQRVPDTRMFLVSAGTPVADPEALLTRARWKALCQGFVEAGATLVAFAPGEAGTAEGLFGQATDVVLVGEDHPTLTAFAERSGDRLRARISEAADEGSGEGDAQEGGPEAAAEPPASEASVALDALAPDADEGPQDDEPMGLEALAPDDDELEAEEEPVEFGALAPDADEGPADDEPMGLDALAPDDDEFEAEEEPVEFGALAPDADEEPQDDEPMELEALAPDDDEFEAEEEPVEFGALAPDADEESQDDEPMGLDALAPDDDELEAEEEPVEFGALAPDADEESEDDEPMGLDALAPDDEELEADAPVVETTATDLDRAPVDTDTPVVPDDRSPKSPDVPLADEILAEAGDAPRQRQDVATPKEGKIRSGRPNLLLVVLLLLLLAAAVGWWIGLVDIPGLDAPVSAEPSVEQPAPGTLEAAEPPDEPAVEISPAASWSIALEAHADLDAAQTRLVQLRQAHPERVWMRVPVRVDQTVYHRVVVGAAPDPVAAQALRAQVAEELGVTGENWLLRATPRAFVLRESATRAEAETRLRELRDQGIPAYRLVVEYSDGTRGHRIYAGGYESVEESLALQGILEDAGVVSFELGDRTGTAAG